LQQQPHHLLCLLACRALIGVAEAPSFPSNTKIIATWFPDHERARATAIYSSAQYIGLALLTPALSFIVANYGWEMSFICPAAQDSVWHLLAYVLPRSAAQHLREPG
jgi:MFS family permease